jgi:hypothetical protein
MLKEWSENVSQQVWLFYPREMPNMRKLDVSGRWDAFSKVSGYSSRARIKCPMNDQDGYSQRSNLFKSGMLLIEVLAIFPKNLVDLEIDVQTINKKLSS